MKTKTIKFKPVFAPAHVDIYAVEPDGTLHSLPHVKKPEYTRDYIRYFVCVPDYLKK